MPWVRAVLRGAKVYARADAGGELAAVNGRVEIRYKPSDGKRYEARADNLDVLRGDVLPDDTCGPAESVEKSKPAASAASGGSGAPMERASVRTGASSAKPVVSTAHPEGVTIAYADGACSGNPGPAGLGVVIFDGTRRVEISEFLGEGTNNIAELTAVLRAIQEVADPKQPLTIRTDSQYTIGVLQKGWKAKANTELVAELRDALKRRPARIEYVPGHSGYVHNERADELAREAVTTRKKRRAVIESKPAG